MESQKEEDKEVEEGEEHDEVVDETSGEPLRAPLRPLYDFRRVLQRLPRMSIQDTQQARRLLLGLHQRFWHANAGDLHNLLMRAGMPKSVLTLIPEVVAHCQVCKKFSKVASRPKVKVHHADTFNQEIQLDIFFLWEQPFLLIIDVATRFKSVVRIANKELNTLMKALLHHWMRWFGPPRTMISDQESALMSPAAAAECERLNITRQPAGTTSGRIGSQKTTTGLVEKHIDLTKLTMLKMRAELERQGMEFDMEDVAAEASMAQNLTINVGGYTPHMAVTGTMPYPFFDVDAPGIISTSGAQQPAISVFEKALRLRQIALTASTQSIMESRIARAGRTRPQQLEITSFKPGVTEVEFHREGADDYGWRGPATLLRVSEEQGTAISEYQGKPYLLPLRVMRHFRGVYHTNMEEDEGREKAELQGWRALRRLMHLTENNEPYRYHTYGYLRQRTGRWIKSPRRWIKSPRDMNERELQDILDDIVHAAQYVIQGLCHGVRSAMGIKRLPVPENTTGTLVLWKKKNFKISMVENPGDGPVVTKYATNENRDDVCYLYFYEYKLNLRTEEEVPPRLQAQPPTTTTTTTTTTNENVPETSEMEVEKTNNEKRQGPDERRVEIQPEIKKQRLEYHMDGQHNPNLFMDMHRRQWITQVPRDEDEGRKDHVQHYTTNLFYFGFRDEDKLRADLLTGNIFKVDETQAMIHEKDVEPIWSQVEAADMKEVKQFVDEKAFRKINRADLKENDKESVIIDAIWVRKWKNTKQERIVKSRLCARGCFDPYKNDMMTRSTTATRLSQKLLLASAVNKGTKVESWDVAGAFLKGLNYKELYKTLRKLGINPIERKVIIAPPANVWRLLSQIDPNFEVPENELDQWLLECLKPVYGLSEAPLAWQLFLHAFIIELGGERSSFDENFYFWPCKTKSRTVAWPEASMTTHVDDLGVEGEQEWLDQQYLAMQAKFGRLTRQTLPFSHCGCRYDKIPDGIRVDQREYVNMLKTAQIAKEEKDDRDLSLQEVSTLRSILGALMWTGITRPDLAAEISEIQSTVNRAKIKDLRRANAVVDRAKKDGEAAIYLKKLPKGRLRLVCIHDASAATSVKNYAQEGVMVMLMEDKLYDAEEHIVCDDHQVMEFMNGTAQLLYAQSNRAKRVSYSTSHGETLAAINGLESSTLISTRLTEITYGSVRPTLQQLLAIQENGSDTFPVDCYTDCRDFWELSTGTKSMPQDKSQRIYTMAHREARASGRIRYIGLIPTEWMTADALTKVMISSSLMELLTTGKVRFKNEGHNVELKRLPNNINFDEDDLTAGDNRLIKLKSNKAINMVAGTIAALGTKPQTQRAMLFTSMIIGAMAQEEEEEEEETATSDWALWITVIMVILSTLMIERMASSMWSWSAARTMTPSTTTRSTGTQTGRVFTDVDTQTVPPPREEAASSSRETVRPPVIRNNPPPSEVFITKNGKTYHRRGCGHIAYTSAPGYRPCKDCFPNVHTQSEEAE